MELVTVNNGAVTTTSRKVAEYFGKRHDNVIRDIEKLLEDKSVAARLNFEVSTYMDSTGRILPQFNLDRDGFTLLAMGFTGKQALTFKLSYIDAFNKAEKLLTQSTPSTPEMQIANAILLAGRMIEEQKQQIEQRDKLIAITAPKAAIADQLVISDGLYNLTHAAKLLNCQPRQFNKDLNAKGWIYRMGVKGTWTGTSTKIKAGYLDHKLHQFSHTDGTLDTTAQVFITVKGMARLSQIFGTELNLQESA